ncbi:helix-turn-helix domain-containing protein [Robertmurraya sp. Marseille-Q9965]
MLDIKIDEKTVSKMLEEAISERVEELAKQKYFFTYSELSKYLNISKPVIEERLIKNGLKYYKMGSKYLFKRSDVDEFLDYITENMSTVNNDFKFITNIKKSF